MVCVSLANYLRDAGWNIRVAVLNLDDAVWQQALSPEIELTILGKKHARSAFFRLYAFIRHNPPERVLVFNHQLAILLVLIRQMTMLHYKIIARNISILSGRYHSQKNIWHKYLVNTMIKTWYKKVDHVIAQSEGMKEDLVDHYGFSGGQVTVIYNPLNPAIEQYLENHALPDIPVETGQRYREPLKTSVFRGCQIPNCNSCKELRGARKTQQGFFEAPYILCVGRLEEVKAFHYAVEAFSVLVQEQPNLRLKIVGTGSLKDALHRQALSLGIADRVDFDGYQQEMIPWYVQASVTCLTSLYEGFPNVLVESIALGTPVVSFDCQSGPREIIQEGVNGFLVRYQDREQLIDALRKALQKDWKRESIRATTERYRIARIAEEYVRVIQS